jgi:very-short-patch-repair endonuclease
MIDWTNHPFGDPKVTVYGENNPFSDSVMVPSEPSPIDAMIEEVRRIADHGRRISMLRVVIRTVAKVDDAIERDVYTDKLQGVCGYADAIREQRASERQAAVRSALESRSGVVLTTTAEKTRPVTESPIEERFADEWARSARHLPLVRQYPVGPYFIDFAHVETRTGIELDGLAAHGSTESIERDRKRQRAIEDAGWHVRRYGGREVHRDVAGCVRDAVALIRKRIRPEASR